MSCTTSVLVAFLASALEAAEWGAEPFIIPALNHAFINPDFIIPEWCTSCCAQQLLPGQVSGPSCLKGALKNSSTLSKASCWKNDHCFRGQTWYLGGQGNQHHQLDFHSCIHLKQLWCASHYSVCPCFARNAWKAPCWKLQHCFVFLLLWGQHHAVDFLGMTKSQTFAAQCYLSKVATPLKRRSRVWALFWELPSEVLGTKHRWLKMLKTQ